MAGKSLVIVESPTKARTIARFLGGEYIVKASNGHIRDLPNSAAEIPLKFKKEAWAKLGVNIADDFAPLYVIPPNKKDNVRELKQALDEADEIYFATDEDREGESISWHLFEALKPKVPVKRLVFHEITKEAIRHALESPREIDQDLVQAQETRRVVDRLFGYEVSPLLWKKMAPRLSAGRVQSVAVRLLVERERERIKFRKAAFWGLKASFAKASNDDATAFEAELTHLGEIRVAIGKDFDPNTGELKGKDGVFALGEEQARALAAAMPQQTPLVESVDETPYSTSPAPPFVTSTLQQEANRQLRFSARHTMGVAQQLYENGFITYMRTDSTTLSDEALTGARRLIKAEFGDEYLPPQPRQYTTKVKNAQEAHEAIRPAGESFVAAAEVARALGPEAARLYTMFWRRTVASQMPNARGTNIAVGIRCGEARLRASGKTIEFPGFLKAYVFGTDDPDNELSEREKLLPKLAAGEALATKSAEALERSTQPPPRYTEGSLIKELERLGIGRPSTWATIVELVLSRSYAFKKGTALIPTFVAFGVVGLLEKHFTNLVDYEFTARLEDDLDAISRGEADRLSYLKSFYFGNGHQGLQKLVGSGEASIDPREVCGIPIGENEDGELVEVRIGRYGPFLSNGTLRASVPDLKPPDELTVEAAMELLRAAAKEPEALGDDPETGKPVFLKNGRFGPYVQLGTPAEGSDEKPKMASLLPNTKPEDVTLEHALELLSLPRTVGLHPGDRKEVIATNGRFGPYVKWGEEIRSIPPDENSPLTISLEAAVELLKQPKGRRRAAKPASLRDVGKHPITEKPLVVMSGRFGPYVTDGELNASLRKGMTPENLTVDDAVELLEARAARIAEGGGAPARRVARKKAAPKKAAKKTVKKVAGKKVAAKKAAVAADGDEGVEEKAS
jgi:DNA topoisomerase-1